MNSSCLDAAAGWYSMWHLLQMRRLQELPWSGPSQPQEPAKSEHGKRLQSAPGRTAEAFRPRPGPCTGWQTPNPPPTGPKCKAAARTFGGAGPAVRSTVWIDEPKSAWGASSCLAAAPSPPAPSSCRFRPAEWVSDPSCTAGRASLPAVCNGVADSAGAAPEADQHPPQIHPPACRTAAAEAGKCPIFCPSRPDKPYSACSCNPQPGAPPFPPADTLPEQSAEPQRGARGRGVSPRGRMHSLLLAATPITAAIPSSPPCTAAPQWGPAPPPVTWLCPCAVHS